MKTGNADAYRSTAAGPVLAIVFIGDIPMAFKHE